MLLVMISRESSVPHPSPVGEEWGTRRSGTSVAPRDRLESRSHTRIWLALRTVALIVAMLCAASPASAAPPINKMCPVMTLEEILPDVSIEYQGQTIGFCCDRCLSKFQVDPQKYLANLPELVVSPPSAHATQPEPVADDPHEDHSQESAKDHSDPASGARGEQGAPLEVEHSEGVPWFGRVHPAIIHFPLAAMPLALLGFVVWVITGREAFAKADVLPLLVGAAASVFAVITGNIAHDAMRFSKNLHVIVERHRRKRLLDRYF